MPITDPAIKAAIKNVTSELTLNDGSNARGGGSLMMVVRRLNDGSTSAIWYARWIRQGKRSKKLIGRYPEITLAGARQMMAADISPTLQAGKSIRFVATPGNKPTVERMFQAYIAHMQDKKRASADEVERMLLLAKYNAADELGRTKLASEVDASNVVEYVSGFYRQGHRGAADKARSYVASAYAWAIKSKNDYTRESAPDWGVKHNPAADVPKDSGATTTRERNLTAKELAQLWNAAKAGTGFSTESAACILMLIGCGQRVQETLRIDGCEIDIEHAVWDMPADKTKGGKRPHSIPLPKQVLPVLQRLIDRRGDGPLFPARTGSKSALIHHSSIKQAIDRWLLTDDCKVKPFQTRDLRRTWKSRAHDAGIDRFTRDLIQQHAKHDTGSKNYDRAEYFPQMREAMDKWSVWLSANGCE